MEALKCEWCQHDIASPLLVEKKLKGETWQYNACDKDCAHGLDVLDRIDEILFPSSKLELMPERHIVIGEEEAEDDTAPPEALPPLSFI